MFAFVILFGEAHLHVNAKPVQPLAEVTLKSFD
jgi:hypothetical protein